MHDIIRVGYISAVNYEEGTAQVVYKDRDNVVSPFFPFASNEYDPPENDTLVYVIHLPNDSTTGMILVPPYTNGNRPPEGKKGIWRKDFGDGSYIRYDRKTKQLDIVSDNVQVENLNIVGDLTVDGKLKVKGAVTTNSITASKITTSGDVHIKGNLSVDGTYPT